jgi:hypothetical protein
MRIRLVDAWRDVEVRVLSLAGGFGLGQGRAEPGRKRLIVVQLLMDIDTLPA